MKKHKSTRTYAPSAILCRGEWHSPSTDGIRPLQMAFALYRWHSPSTDSVLSTSLGKS
ncbi:MAG: hypothetical protein F6K39_32930 [Okeania sp. SIO3B3]|nr:hypothetical protein [Okeania sp. SIO3B3]